MRWIYWMRPRIDADVRERAEARLRGLTAVGPRRSAELAGLVRLADAGPGPRYPVPDPSV